MSTEPFRFIHAANLFVDHALRDTAELPEWTRPVVRDAALDAFRRVIELALEHEADFLLLTGNTFDEGDRSLRAEAALLEGFERLDQHGVQVFVLPGDADPPSAWRAIPGLPENVSVLFTAGTAAFEVRRGDQLLARIADGRQPGETPRSVSSRRCAGIEPASAPFLIETHSLSRSESVSKPSDAAGVFELPPSSESGLAQILASRSCDYLALACGDTRQTIASAKGVAHSPGATQGLDRLQSGPHGCTLVDVDAEGSAQCSFLATAPVRWESLPLPNFADPTPEQVAEWMHEALADCRPEPGEQMWIVTWSIPGNSAGWPLPEGGSLPQTLRRRDSQEEVRLAHVFEFASAARIESAKCGDLSTFAGQYLQKLRSAEPLPSDLLADCFQEIVSIDESWRARVRSLCAGLDYRVVSRRARHHGTRWFASAVETSP